MQLSKRSRQEVKPTTTHGCETTIDSRQTLASTLTLQAFSSLQESQSLSLKLEEFLPTHTIIRCLNDKERKEPWNCVDKFYN